MMHHVCMTDLPDHSGNVRADVAANVRAELARQRKPQKALREHLGISRVTMHRRITGQSPFDADELVGIAEFLDIPIGTLFQTQATEASA
jgi:transcriptional regulator with XRE-family HTH domain